MPTHLIKESILKDLLYFIGNICSTALGLFQLYAITMGITAYFGWHWAIGIFIAIFVAPIPILGTVAAIWCATHAWHWPLLKACGYFLIPLAVVIILTGTAGGLSALSKARKLSSE